ncbi:MAG: hypothetical protein E6G29_05040 [Actinobacteria bacterium]|nr:MAG: hypothetical protein E6G29_05040 [Actinomycetota bacterium]
MPWRFVVQAAVWLYRWGRERLDRLSPRERQELFDLLRKSRGRASNLSGREQQRVRDLLRRAFRE